MDDDLKNKIFEKMLDAEEKAWMALSAYKFWIFGGHASRWVYYNKLLPRPERRTNIFKELVKIGRENADQGELLRGNKR
jgi:hypothetical protein